MSGSSDAMNPTFRHVRPSNWRNFRKVDVALRDRMFIVGPNATGKTNLLDAFRFLHDIATHGGSLARALGTRGDLAHLRSLHARRASTVAIEVELEVDGDRWTYELELSDRVVADAFGTSHAAVSSPIASAAPRSTLIAPNADAPVFPIVP